MIPKSKSEIIFKEKKVIENFPGKFSDMEKYPLVAVMVLIVQKDCNFKLASSKIQTTDHILRSRVNCQYLHGKCQEYHGQEISGSRQGKTLSVN
jgi:hypothetical protein